MSRPGYSRAHYRRVSPPSDTPAELAERLRHKEACAAAVADRLAKYPAITPENAAEVLAYQEERIAFHDRRLA